MLSRLRNFLKPPTFEDPEKNIRAGNINTILLFILALTFIFFLYALFVPPRIQIVFSIGALGIEIGLSFLLRTGRVSLTSIIFTALLWVAISIEEILFGGVSDSGFASYAIVIVVAGLSMGIQSGIAYTFLTILAGIGMIYLENQGLLTTQIPVSNSAILVSHTITFVSVLLLVYLAIRNINKSSRKIIEDDRTTREINTLLEQNRNELQEIKADLELHSSALELVVESSRLANQVMNENELVEKTVALASEHLHLDHVGLYLTDENEEHVTLRATNSKEGMVLLREGYQLTLAQDEFTSGVNPTELNRYTAGKKIFISAAPIQLSAASNNLCIPLIAMEQFIGLINIQSFSAETKQIAPQILRTFADQTALSIANIRLAGQLQEHINEVSRLAGDNVKNAWEQLSAGGALGFLYDNIHVTPSDEMVPGEVRKDLLSQKTVHYTTLDDPPHAKLAAPIVLRGNVIGVMGYENSDPQHEWLPDEITMLEAISSRVSLALENTRLVADAQQRANRERTMSQVASRMRETLDIDVILQTAVQEIRKSLGLKQAEVLLTAGIAPQQEENQSDGGAGYDKPRS